ncbi:hypothetical protein BC629DRAFT_565949 [Irpex lacteus]|nr:hypothetical protein BC629DRAFT_565949 [Irpex lacteus]
MFPEGVHDSALECGSLCSGYVDTSVYDATFAGSSQPGYDDAQVYPNISHEWVHQPQKPDASRDMESIMALFDVPVSGTAPLEGPYIQGCKQGHKSIQSSELATTSSTASQGGYDATTQDQRSVFSASMPEFIQGSSCGTLALGKYPETYNAAPGSGVDHGTFQSVNSQGHSTTHIAQNCTVILSRSASNACDQPYDAGSQSHWAGPDTEDYMPANLVSDRVDTDNPWYYSEEELAKSNAAINIYKGSTASVAYPTYGSNSPLQIEKVDVPVSESASQLDANCRVKSTTSTQAVEGPNLEEVSYQAVLVPVLKAESLPPTRVRVKDESLPPATTLSLENGPSMHIQVVPKDEPDQTAPVPLVKKELSQIALAPGPKKEVLSDPADVITFEVKGRKGARLWQNGAVQHEVEVIDEPNEQVLFSGDKIVYNLIWPQGKDCGEAQFKKQMHTHTFKKHKTKKEVQSGDGQSGNNEVNDRGKKGHSRAQILQQVAKLIDDARKVCINPIFSSAFLTAFLRCIQECIRTLKIGSYRRRIYIC